ncbi:MAG: hypothetical protein RL462_5 [Pseudomonadota bacterium]|jgi:hypothetical protein
MIKIAQEVITLGEFIPFAFFTWERRLKRNISGRGCVCWELFLCFVARKAEAMGIIRTQV